MLAAAGPGAVHVLRDPTRGGLVGVRRRDRPRRRRRASSSTRRRSRYPRPCASACSFLGLDPLQVANEGKLVAFVAAEHAEAVLATMRARPEGAAAAVIGRVVDEHPGMAVARTPFGTTRVVERELGEQLPRIC